MFKSFFHNLDDFLPILEVIFCLDALLGPRRLQGSILVAKNAKKLNILEAKIEIFGITLKWFFAWILHEISVAILWFLGPR